MRPAEDAGQQKKAANADLRATVGNGQNSFSTKHCRFGCVSRIAAHSACSPVGHSTAGDGDHTSERGQEDVPAPKIVRRKGGVGSPVGVVSATPVADFFQHCGVEKVLLSSVGVEARRMLQTNQVVQADNMNDKCIGQLVGLATRDQIGIPMRAIRGPHKVKIPSVRIKGEAVAVENRLVVKNEWQPLWPFPGPRVQTVEHIHERLTFSRERA